MVLWSSGKSALLPTMGHRDQLHPAGFKQGQLSTLFQGCPMRGFSCFMPRFVAVTLFMIVLGLSSPVSVQGQVTRADSAAVLLRAGQAFQSEGRWEVAEAIYHYILERYGDTPSAASAQTALEEATGEGSSQSSQVELMVWATTYGAWLGVAIPGAFGADDVGVYGAGLLLARAYSRSRPLSAGQARAITFGSLWGTWQSYALMDLLDLGEKEHCEFDYCYIEDPDGETIMKALVVGGLAGTLGGALIAKRPISRGAPPRSALRAVPSRSRRQSVRQARGAGRRSSCGRDRPGSCLRDPGLRGCRLRPLSG